MKQLHRDCAASDLQLGRPGDVTADVTTIRALPCIACIVNRRRVELGRFGSDDARDFL